MRAAIVTGVSRGLGSPSPRRCSSTASRSWASAARAARADGRALPFRARRSRRHGAHRPVLTPSFQTLAGDKPASVCLINNAAAAGPVGVLGTLDDVDAATSLAVNLAGPVVLANLFCRIFGGDGAVRRIINVSSGAAQRALPGEAMYCVAKAGLEMLTAALAAEHQEPDFQSISVRPGIIDTEMQAFARSQSREVLPCVDMFVEFHSQGRLVPPDQVAAKIVDRLVVGEVENGRTYSYQEL